MAKVYVTKDGDMLDDICWKHYGRTSGAVEKVIEANPHLATAPLQLVANVSVTLPDIAKESEETLTNLWD